MRTSSGYPLGDFVRQAVVVRVWNNNRLFPNSPPRMTRPDCRALPPIGPPPAPHDRQGLRRTCRTVRQISEGRSEEWPPPPPEASPDIERRRAGVRSPVGCVPAPHPDLLDVVGRRVMAQQVGFVRGQVELGGPVRKGKVLRRSAFQQQTGTYQYVARTRDCQSCPIKESCLPSRQNDASLP